jgi:hypothetical protein
MKRVHLNLPLLQSKPAQRHRLIEDKQWVAAKNCKKHLSTMNSRISCRQSSKRVAHYFDPTSQYVALFT